MPLCRLCTFAQYEYTFQDLDHSSFSLLLPGKSPPLGQLFITVCNSVWQFIWTHIDLYSTNLQFPTLEFATQRTHHFRAILPASINAYGALCRVPRK